MDINLKLSQHFKLREFLHNENPDGITENILNNLIKTANVLEEIRSQCGNRVIIINSGFRTKKHNKEVGGAPHSLHCLGMAADIEIKELSPKNVQQCLINWRGGLGCYSNWTHVDWGSKRRWCGS
jgi:uncharacterized protein YcbK (DUF882 family)